MKNTCYGFRDDLLQNSIVIQEEIKNPKNQWTVCQAEHITILSCINGATLKGI